MLEENLDNIVTSATSLQGMLGDLQDKLQHVLVRHETDFFKAYQASEARLTARRRTCRRCSASSTC